MKLKNYKIVLIAAIIFAISVNTVAAIEGVTKRVKFPKGKSSTTISNAVIRGDQDTYILGAKSGQTMSVKVTALEKNAAFQIQAPDGSYVSGAGETDDATSWSGQLPSSGDYRITVGGTRGNASYKLTVSIK